MRTIKRILSLLPFMLMWLMLSAFLWSWIFSLLTDTAPENKVTLFTNVWHCKDVELSAALETELPDGISMVKVHPFSYAMVDGSQLTNADLYIVKASDISEYAVWFAPVPDELVAFAAAPYAIDGVPYGLLVYDAVTDTGAASDYLTYVLPETPHENCYLFFGAHSLHLAGNDAALDNSAVQIARTLLLLP